MLIMIQRDMALSSLSKEDKTNIEFINSCYKYFLSHVSEFNKLSSNLEVLKKSKFEETKNVFLYLTHERDIYEEDTKDIVGAVASAIFLTELKIKSSL